jgi:hypothetical protein
MRNTYFDSSLAAQHDQLIERAVTQLVMLKTQQAGLQQEIS